MIDEYIFMKSTRVRLGHHEHALKYAVATSGASAEENSMDIADRCYRLARHHLESAESAADSAAFLDIGTVQALILIARFELKHKPLTRVRMTTARLRELIYALELDMLDLPIAEEDVKLNPSPSPVAEPGQIGNIRLTFWFAWAICTRVQSLTERGPYVKDASMVKIAQPGSGGLY
jgi:hypothetical protein